MAEGQGFIHGSGDFLILEKTKNASLMRLLL